VKVLFKIKKVYNQKKISEIVAINANFVARKLTKVIKQK